MTHTTKDIPSSHPFRYLDILMTLFVTTLIISNIASSAKIIDWGIRFGSFKLSFDAGTLLFPVSYIFGDVLAEVYGYRNARKVIWVGFACLAFSAIVLWGVSLLPGEANWEAYAGQGAYQAIFGGMISGGIVIASLSGYIIGSLSNAITLVRIKEATQGRWLWMRTIGSTLIGEALDSLAFIGVATLFKVFPAELFWSLVITNYVFKVVIEALMTPVTYRSVSFLKKREQAG